MHRFALTIAIAAGAAGAQVSPGTFTPTAVENFEAFPGSRFDITSIFGGAVTVARAGTRLVSLNQGQWRDFRTAAQPPVVPSSGTRFAAIELRAAAVEFDFTGLPGGGIQGFAGFATAATSDGDTIEFLDAGGNVIDTFTNPGGFGTGDGTMEAFSFVSDQPIARIRWTGAETAIDDIAYLRLPPPATQLGRIASSQVPTLIETFGSGLDTEIALWDERGVLLGQNDDFATVQSRILTQLPAGRYYVAVGGFNSVFAEGFVASGGSRTGNYVLTVAGRRAANAVSGVGEVDFFTFEVGDTVDPLTLAGPMPALELGVLAAPGQPIAFTVPGGTGLPGGSIIDRRTGQAVVLLNPGDSASLPAGEYILALTIEDFVGDGYQNDAARLLPGGTISCTFGGIQIGPREVGIDENVYVGFEVGTPTNPADFNGDGIRDIFDIIAFFAAFGA